MDTLTRQKIASSRVETERKSREVSAESSKDDSIYHKIVGDLNFDLYYMLRELKSRNTILTNEIRKRFLIKWHFADIQTRKPQLIEDVASALMISRLAIMEWIDSGWFNDEVERVKKKIDVMLKPHIQKVLATKALNGDPKALQEFFEQSNESSKDRSGLDLTNIPEDIIDEARAISDAENKRIRLDNDEQDLSENISEKLQ